MSKKLTQKKVKKSLSDNVSTDTTRVPSSRGYHIDGVREIACGIVLQAVEDCWNKNRYKSKHQQAIIVEARRTAKHFLNSRSFEQICSILPIELPADKIREVAFHPAKFPEVIAMLRARKKR
jgi:hypothetical protein